MRLDELLDKVNLIMCNEFDIFVPSTKTKRYYTLRYKWSSGKWKNDDDYKEVEYREVDTIGVDEDGSLLINLKEVEE